MPIGSYNHCNLPPWVIASRHFNDNPQPIELMGVREGNRFLFQRLEEIDSAEERAVFFNDYMSVKFQLHHWQSQTDTALTPGPAHAQGIHPPELGIIMGLSAADIDSCNFVAGHRQE